MPESAECVLGIVSNCWKVQLDNGTSLETLVEQAVDEGFRAVELRQGCLGEYESIVMPDGSADNDCERFTALSQRFRGVSFNLAVSLPCFGGHLRGDDPRFRAAFAAAHALAPSRSPHLRLVDTQTRTPRLSADAISEAGKVIADMTNTLVNAGGQLSVEHAYQCWDDFWSAMQQARRHLGSSALQLRCCFDPCNLLLTEPPASIGSIVDSVVPDDVSMIHLKQRREGQIQPDVARGDLDWPQLLQSLQRRGHRGPWLFEVAPDVAIWQNLRRSANYFGSGRGNSPA